MDRIQHQSDMTTEVGLVVAPKAINERAKIFR